MSGHVSVNGAILEASTFFFGRPSRFPRVRARASAPLIVEHGGAANVNLCDVHRRQGVKKTVWHAFYSYGGEGGIETPIRKVVARLVERKAEQAGSERGLRG
jgi:hypothetical protein